jgi:ComF family protein
MNYILKRKLLHFFFPTRCPVCGEFIGALDSFCPACTDKVTSFRGSADIKGASGFTAAFEYDINISPAVILLKKGVCGNADYALGRALAGRLKENNVPGNVDIIVPVPLHRSARRRRGFNQTELISAVVSRELGIPVVSNALEKSAKTADQKHLDSIHRRTNLRGAFRAVRPELISGKRVLLIDDVSTTGSTLVELTELLLASGASSVHCAACCKTPPKRRKQPKDE